MCGKCAKLACLGAHYLHTQSNEKMFRKSLLGVKSRSGATQRKPQQEKPGQQQQQQQQAAPPPASSKLTQLRTRGNITGKQEEGTKQVLDRRQHNQLQVRYFRYF